MKALRVKDNSSAPHVSSSAAATSPGSTYCSCLGSKHPAVSNCTACGYIVCQRVTALAQHAPNALPLHPELAKGGTNSSFLSLVAQRLCMCPFCGVDCFTVPTAKDLELYELDLPTVTAYANKDKLLVFDREHAQRTVVRDAQADYYTNSTWLNEEEKEAMEEKERKRVAKRMQRKQRKYTIRFDIAGRKVVEQTDDSSDDDGQVEERAADLGAVCENVELELSDSRAGEVYRFIKQSFESSDETAQAKKTAVRRHVDVMRRVQQEDE